MMDVNTNSMKYIIDACIKWDAKLIYASSAGVYGNTEAPMREDRGLIPENVYGFSKLMADNLVKNKMEELRQQGSQKEEMMQQKQQALQQLEYLKNKIQALEEQIKTLE